MLGLFWMIHMSNQLKDREGMLVAFIIGIGIQVTMDIDTTVKTLSMKAEDAERIVSGGRAGTSCFGKKSYRFK